MPVKRLATARRTSSFPTHAVPYGAEARGVSNTQSSVKNAMIVSTSWRANAAADPRRRATVTATGTDRSSRVTGPGAPRYSRAVNASGVERLRVLLEDAFPEAANLDVV